MPDSRQQRRAAAREDLVIGTRLVLYTTKGHVIELDVDKVDIVDRDTGKPLFKHAEEAETVPSDTVVQDGNFTGMNVHPGTTSVDMRPTGSNLSPAMLDMAIKGSAGHLQEIVITKAQQEEFFTDDLAQAIELYKDIPIKVK